MYEIYCKLRDLKGLKDSDVSKGADVSKSTFSDWKSGRSTPKKDKLIRIANFFGVSVDYLMTGEENSITDDMVSEHIELISLYEQLNDKQKENVINLMKAFLEM